MSKLFRASRTSERLSESEEEVGMRRGGENKRERKREAERETTFYKYMNTYNSQTAPSIFEVGNRFSRFMWLFSRSFRRLTFAVRDPSPVIVHSVFFFSNKNTTHQRMMKFSLITIGSKSERYFPYTHSLSPVFQFQQIIEIFKS